MSAWEAPAEAKAYSLYGEHRNAIDGQRRVPLPKQLREQMAESRVPGETYYVCRDLGGRRCLNLFPPGVFEQRLAAMRSRAAETEREEHVDYLRAVQRSLSRQRLDRQHRLRLTPKQCELAGGLGGEVVFLGMVDYVELWAPEVLDALERQQDFRKLAARVRKGGDRGRGRR